MPHSRDVHEGHAVLTPFWNNGALFRLWVRTAEPTGDAKSMRQAIATASFETAPSLLRVFDTARRFVAYRAREAALQTGAVRPPATLSEAIDRDFLAFELRRAERDLRDAVVALDPDLDIFSETISQNVETTSLAR